MSEQMDKLLAELTALAIELGEEAKIARELGMDGSVQRELRIKLIALCRRYREPE